MSERSTDGYLFIDVQCVDCGSLFDIGADEETGEPLSMYCIWCDRGDPDKPQPGDWDY